ncbi:hypothetical protein CHUAL_009819 [Chamberlinius hualienensis]
MATSQIIAVEDKEIILLLKAKRDSIKKMCHKVLEFYEKENPKQELQRQQIEAQALLQDKSSHSANNCPTTMRPCQKCQQLHLTVLCRSGNQHLKRRKDDHQIANKCNNEEGEPSISS